MKKSDAQQAARGLEKALDAMNAASPNRAIHSVNRNLYNGALASFSQAVGCRLSPLARSLIHLGDTVRDATETTYRYVEDEASRHRIGEARNKFLTMTEDMIASALKENCSCKESDRPAPLIGLLR